MGDVIDMKEEPKITHKFVYKDVMSNKLMFI